MSVEKKAYEDALTRIRIRTLGKEPKDPAARARFEQEQEACARIASKNLLDFDDCDFDYEPEEEPSTPLLEPSKPGESE